jgi:hypothetical protein
MTPALLGSCVLKLEMTVAKLLKVLTDGPESVTKVDCPTPANSYEATVKVLPGLGPGAGRS